MATTYFRVVLAPDSPVWADLVESGYSDLAQAYFPLITDEDTDIMVADRVLYANKFTGTVLYMYGSEDDIRVVTDRMRVYQLTDGTMWINADTYAETFE